MSLMNMRICGKERNPARDVLLHFRRCFWLVLCSAVLGGERLAWGECALFFFFVLGPVLPLEGAAPCFACSLFDVFYDLVGDRVRITFFIRVVVEGV